MCVRGASTSISTTGPNMLSRRWPGNHAVQNFTPGRLGILPKTPWYSTQKKFIWKFPRKIGLDNSERASWYFTETTLAVYFGPVRCHTVPSFACSPSSTNPVATAQIFLITLTGAGFATYAVTLIAMQL